MLLQRRTAHCRTLYDAKPKLTVPSLYIAGFAHDERARNAARGAAAASLTEPGAVSLFSPPSTSLADASCCGLIVQQSCKDRVTASPVPGTTRRSSVGPGRLRPCRRAWRPLGRRLCRSRPAAPLHRDCCCWWRCWCCCCWWWCRRRRRRRRRRRVIVVVFVVVVVDVVDVVDAVVSRTPSSGRKGTSVRSSSRGW